MFRSSGLSGTSLLDRWCGVLPACWDCDGCSLALEVFEYFSSETGVTSRRSLETDATSRGSLETDTTSRRSLETDATSRRSLETDATFCRCSETDVTSRRSRRISGILACALTDWLRGDGIPLWAGFWWCSIGWMAVFSCEWWVGHPQFVSFEDCTMDRHNPGSLPHICKSKEKYYMYNTLRSILRPQYCTAIKRYIFNVSRWAQKSQMNYILVK